MGGHRRPWYEIEGASRPVLLEVLKLYRAGMANLEVRPLNIPHIVQAAALMTGQSANEKQASLVEAFFDRLFGTADSSAMGDGYQRDAASKLFGHHDSTFGMPYERRRLSVAKDYYYQEVETFRRPDRGGMEPQLLRAVASVIEKVINAQGGNSANPMQSGDIFKYVRFEDSIATCRGILKRNGNIIGVVGGRGTGKTVLANQLAREITQSPIAFLRASEPDVLRADILEALLLEGFEPTNWSDLYCQVTLKRRMSGHGQLHCGAIIIDDVRDQQLIPKLVSEDPVVPVIFTQRYELHTSNYPTFHHRGFSEQEAYDFLVGRLGDSDTTGYDTCLFGFSARSHSTIWLAW